MSYVKVRRKGMIATITSKGQVTLPKSIRAHLRLHAGDKLDFFIKKDKHIEVVPLKESPVNLKGMLPKPKHPVTIEEMNQAIAIGASKE
jgi:antitoxin PrlF